MRLLQLLAIVLGVVTGCSQERVGVNVACEVKKGPVVECVVAQTKGTAEVEACWDFKVTCAVSGAIEAPRTCAKIKGGETTTVTIPTDKIKVSATCEGKQEQGNANLTINGESAK